MSTLNYILIFTFLGSIGGLIGGFLLLASKNYAYRLSHYLSPFAAGVLLTVAFIELLPEAAEEAEELGVNIFIWVLAGILLFFIIERFIHWFHHHEKTHEHEHEHEKEGQSTVPLIVIGDTVHNFVDGVIIAAAFLVDIPFGIITALAVFAHEVPQEVADFGILLHKGLSRLKAIVINIFTASSAFVGALIAYSLGHILDDYIPMIVAMTAGFFIYIATSDLIPEIHYEKKRSTALAKSVMLIVGVIVMWVVISLLGNSH